RARRRPPPPCPPTPRRSPSPRPRRTPRRTRAAERTAGASLLLHEAAEERPRRRLVLLFLVVAHRPEPHLAHGVDVLWVLLDDLLEVPDRRVPLPRHLEDHRAVEARALVARVVEQDGVEARHEVVVLARLAPVGLLRLDPHPERDGIRRLRIELEGALGERL